MAAFMQKILGKLRKAKPVRVWGFLLRSASEGGPHVQGAQLMIQEGT